MQNSYISTTTDHRSPASQSPWAVTIDLSTLIDAANGEADMNGPIHTAISQTYQLRDSVYSLTEQVTAHKLKTLETEHEQARVAARSAMDNYQSAKNRELDYINAEQKAADDHTNALKRLNALKNSQPHPNQYPTQAEIHQWKEDVFTAEMTASDKLVAIERTAKDSQLFYSDLQQLAAAFNEASKREFELRERLNTLKGISNVPHRINGLQTA
jgi:hypothetical protein